MAHNPPSYNRTEGEKPESLTCFMRRSTVDIESYIKNLSPELQEKARACGSVEELLALAKEAKLPVPDEILEAIPGGDQPDPENCKPYKVKCPNCGSTNVTFDWYFGVHHCNDCGINFP